MDRIQLLNQLIQFSRPLKGIKQELNKFDWDTDKPLITLKRKEMSDIINKLLNQEISLHDLVSWANFIEMRDDIEYEKKYESKIAELIFIIANPDLMDTRISSHKDLIIGSFRKLL